MTILVFGFGASNHSVLFLLTMHEVAGGCMKARGRVKMIQQEREARKINLPFCHLKGNRYHISPDKFGSCAILINPRTERIDKGLKHSLSLCITNAILYAR